MAVDFYLTPGVRDTDPVKGYNRYLPKYFDTIWKNYSKSFMDVGLSSDAFLVAVTNISAADDLILTTDVDVHKLPALANQVGGAALNNVRNMLEALGIPGNWVQSSTTYQTILHFVGPFCVFMQRYNAVENSFPALFDGTTNLNSTWNSLSQGQQDGLRYVAQSWKTSQAPNRFDTSAVTGATQLRAIFKGLADQWPTVVGAMVMQGIVL